MISSLQPKRPVAGGGSSHGTSQVLGGSLMQQQQWRESATASSRSDVEVIEKTQGQSGDTASVDARITNEHAGDKTQMLHDGQS